MATEYTAIDKHELIDHLGELATLLEDANIEDEREDEIDNVFGNINGLIHSVEKPIHITDRHDGFEIVVTED